mmetsp:Transcript_13950/g.52083  ORF Transcript_13950/g.52083 Transcript_13950/m.52083 type:complete len:273 (-) Transcript_13950:54-872(-)
MCSFSYRMVRSLSAFALSSRTSPFRASSLRHLSFKMLRRLCCCCSDEDAASYVRTTRERMLSMCCLLNTRAGGPPPAWSVPSVSVSSASSTAVAEAPRSSTALQSRTRGSGAFSPASRMLSRSFRGTTPKRCGPAILMHCTKRGRFGPGRSGSGLRGCLAGTGPSPQRVATILSMSSTSVAMPARYSSSSSLRCALRFLASSRTVSWSTGASCCLRGAAGRGSGSTVLVSSGRSRGAKSSYRRWSSPHTAAAVGTSAALSGVSASAATSSST